jgi:tetraacyldisaccharide 4'-kinase
MRQWLERQWYPDKIGFWSVFFKPFEMLLGLLVSLRKLSYKVGFVSSWRSPVPVVVVGNITLGGTGKTPLVIWLAQQLVANGYSPGIVSRGYGGSMQGMTFVSTNSDPRLVGDEPLLIAMRTACPVWVGKKRPAVINALLQANPQCDVIISDDGLQHYAMQRDFEIVVIDGARHFGNGAMLPFGPMREPAWRADEADALVVNGGEADFASGEYLMRLHGQDFYSLHTAERVSANFFAGKRIFAVAGIGNPARFFNHLRQLSLEFVEHAFPDHHQFQVGDLQMLGADIILMTEKDAVKCLKFPLTNIWVLPVQAEVVGGLGDKVIEKIESFYGRKVA